MVNEVTAPTRKDKMASRTAATGLGMGGPSDRRESWIPYPTLPDSGETEGTMDYADFTRLCIIMHVFKLSYIMREILVFFSTHRPSTTNPYRVHLLNPQANVITSRTV
jgi:hypothetical protein